MPGDSIDPVNRSRAFQQAGYSLVEALAAIALVGMGLLAASSGLQSHAASARRSELRQLMVTASEEAIEAVRGGDLPLESGPVGTPSVADRFQRDGIRTTLRVAPREVEGLYEVTAVARVRFLGEPMTVELATMVWRP